MDPQSKTPGRLLKAPEHFLDTSGVRQVFAEGKGGRRDFIRAAFATAGAMTGAAAAAAVSAPRPLSAASNPVPQGAGDPNILQLPAHSTGLLTKE